MDLREEVYGLTSTQSCSHITAYVGTNSARWKTLLDLYLSEELRVSQGASWALGALFKAHPKTVPAYLPRLVEHLAPTRKDVIKRNTIRLLQDVEIPEDLRGVVADKCFNYLADPKEAIAIHVFSMTVLFNLGKLYPDLLPELKLLIEERMHHGSTGLKNRGAKILAAIKKRTK